MISAEEHLCTHLLAIRMSSLINCLQYSDSLPIFKFTYLFWYWATWVLYVWGINPPIRYQIYSLQVFPRIRLDAFSFCWWSPLHCRSVLVWCKKQLSLALSPQTHSNTHHSQVGQVRYKRGFLSFKGQTKFINFQVILKLYERQRVLMENQGRIPKGQNWCGVASQRSLTLRERTVSTRAKNNDKGKTKEAILFSKHTGWRRAALDS